MKHDSAIDICFVYTLAGDMLETLKQEHFPRSASAMEKVAEHYGIPSIHMGVELARFEKAGKLSFKARNPRPNLRRLLWVTRSCFRRMQCTPIPTQAHQLYLEAVRCAPGPRSKRLETPGPHPLPTPFSC